MTDGPVEIAAYETAPQAYHLKGYLESRGIPAYVADELTGGWMGAYNRSIGGIRVMVAPEDVERALVELETFEANLRPHPGEGSAEAEEGDTEEAFEAEVDESDADEALPAAPTDEAEVEAPSGPAEPVATDDPTGEGYAKKTRVFAVIGLAAPVFAPIALFRAFSSPPGVELSPRARSVLTQARVLGFLGTVLLLAIIYRIAHR